MAKLTVAEIKKKIAILEARAAGLAEEEAKASIRKVHALMNQLGVTLEHLSSDLSNKASSVMKAVVGKKSPPAKRFNKGAAKYVDPKSGKTWSGFGRAPRWIAGAKNRDAFLVEKSGIATSGVAVKALISRKKPTAKKDSAKKVAKSAAKKAVAVVKNVATPSPAKKKLPAKKTALKAAAKKVAKKTAMPGGASTVSTSAEADTPSAT